MLIVMRTTVLDELVLRVKVPATTLALSVRDGSHTLHYMLSTATAVMRGGDTRLLGRPVYRSVRACSSTTEDFSDNRCSSFRLTGHISLIAVLRFILVYVLLHVGL